MHIQGSGSNGMFQWINPYKYRNPTITSITVLFRPNQVMFNNVDSTNVITNSNEEEVTIPPGYSRSVRSLPSSTLWLKPRSPYLRMLRVMNISIFSPLTHHRFHQCSRYLKKPRIRRTNIHANCFVLCIECDWYYSKSPNDPSVFIIGPILRSEDCQPQQQSVHHNDHWSSHHQLCRLMEDIFMLMITRFDRLIFVFKDLEGNIMRLNGEFELQLTVKDVYDHGLPRCHLWTISPWSKCWVIVRRRK